ncbi:MAG: flagellar hook-associated protein FlgK [Pseudomonadota bacterium]
MSSILGIGTSALSAFRRSLDTVGQNIANANTPGYNRQRVQLSARSPQFSGVGFFGRGVEINSVERYYNAFLDNQVRNAGSSASRFETLAGFGGRVDDLLADPLAGLAPALSSFYAAVQDFSLDPATPASRGALFAEAESLVARFQSLDDQLAAVSEETSQAVAQTVSEINQLSTSIADLNQRIVTAGTQRPPNDLLDERDQLVRELTRLVDVTVTEENNGSINVFVGNGQTLVIGGETFELEVQPSEFDPNRNEVIYRGLGGDTPLRDILKGGQIGGLFEFQNTILDPTRRALGASAVAVAQTLNEQNALGLDANGNLGGDIFATGPARGTPSALNSGTGDISVVVEDVGQVPQAGYRFLFDGTNYRLFRDDTGAELTLSGTGTGADPFRADGLAITVSGTPAAGDTFEVEPVLDAISGLSVVASDPGAFAAAGPTRGSADLNNLSDASIDNGVPLDTSDPDFFATSVIEFTGPNTYSVNGAGSFAFTPGDTITLNGSAYTLTGSPATGDRFTVERNTNAAGDNRNALALGATRDAGVLASGSQSVSQAYASLVATVGSRTRLAENTADAQAIVLQSAETRRLEESGVNLDEEAAELIRFQQAYQAAAEVISVAGDLFDTLLAATRR